MTWLWKLKIANALYQDIWQCCGSAIKLMTYYYEFWNRKDMFSTLFAARSTCVSTTIVRWTDGCECALTKMFVLALWFFLVKFMKAHNTIRCRISWALHNWIDSHEFHCVAWLPSLAVAIPSRWGMLFFKLKLIANFMIAQIHVIIIWCAHSPENLFRWPR